MKNILEMNLADLKKSPGYIPSKNCPACKEYMSFEMLKGYICINKKCKKTYGHNSRSKNAVLGAIAAAMKYQKKS